MKTFIFVVYVCMTSINCTYMIAPFEFLTWEDCMKFKDKNDKEILQIYKENKINPSLFYSKCHEVGTPLETNISTLPLNAF